MFPISIFFSLVLSLSTINTEFSDRLSIITKILSQPDSIDKVLSDNSLTTFSFRKKIVKTPLLDSIRNYLNKKSTGKFSLVRFYYYREIEDSLNRVVNYNGFGFIGEKNKDEMFITLTNDFDEWRINDITFLKISKPKFGKLKYSKMNNPNAVFSPFTKEFKFIDKIISSGNNLKNLLSKGSITTQYCKDKFNKNEILWQIYQRTFNNFTKNGFDLSEITYYEDNNRTENKIDPFYHNLKINLTDSINSFWTNFQFNKNGTNLVLNDIRNFVEGNKSHPFLYKTNNSYELKIDSLFDIEILNINFNAVFNEVWEGNEINRLYFGIENKTNLNLFVSINPEYVQRADNMHYILYYMNSDTSLPIFTDLNWVQHSLNEFKKYRNLTINDYLLKDEYHPEFKQKHIRATLVLDGLALVVHLSKERYKPEDDILMNKVLKSIIIKNNLSK